MDGSVTSNSIYYKRHKKTITAGMGQNRQYYLIKVSSYFNHIQSVFTVDSSNT